LDLADVTYVKRIVVGSNDPKAPKSEAEVAEALALLNRCLSEPPKGRIIGIERSFVAFQVGENAAILQWLVYHVGFQRRPYWDESPP
jgi:hypothetical protein